MSRKLFFIFAFFGLIIFILSINSVLAGDGTSSGNAGTSCTQILNDGYSTGNGTYWIDPDGVGGNSSFQVYCDMDTAGGGWTLVAKKIQTCPNSEEACTIASYPNFITYSKLYSKNYVMKNYTGNETITTIYPAWQQLNFTEIRIVDNKYRFDYSMNKTNISMQRLIEACYSSTINISRGINSTLFMHVCRGFSGGVNDDGEAWVLGYSNADSCSSGDFCAMGRDFSTMDTKATWITSDSWHYDSGNVSVYVRGNLTSSIPSVTIIYPQNTNYTINVSELNYSVSGTNLSSCWYSLDNGATNSSYYSAGTNFTSLTSNEGSNTWVVYCNGTNNTIGSRSVNFYKDTILPNVTLNAPSGGYTNSTTSSINITFNCSTADNLALKNISLYLTNSSNLNFALNRTTNITGAINTTNWTLTLGAGNYTWNCLAFDSLGNSNWSTNRTIFISSIDPVYPTFSNLGFNYSNASVYTIGRNYLANSTITSTNGTSGINFNGANYTAKNSSSLFSATIGQLSAGTYSYYWWAYGNGTNRNFNITQIYYYTINQSTGSVNGTINGTQNNFTVWNGTANQNIRINATNITGYGTGKIYVNGSVINSGTMPLSNLTNLSVGFYNITFVYDGNTNYTSDTKVLWVNVSVYVDPVYPIFYNKTDNNGTISVSGNVSISANINNTNGTAWVQFNGTNYTMSNSSNRFNVSFYKPGVGTYEYIIGSYGNGTSKNINTTQIYYYTILSDIIYPQFSNYYDNSFNFTGNGTARFNVTILNTNRTVWLEINNTNYTANNISANTWNYSLSLTNGTYSYYWWAYGNGTNKNINNSGLRSYIINNADLTAPQIIILSPANTTYNDNTIDFNISSNENLSFCKFSINNWAANYTMSVNSSKTGANYTLSNLADNSYIAKFWCNDTSNNINNSESISFVLNASAVIINSFSIFPYSAINGTNVSLYASVSKPEYIWANITLPNLSSQIITLLNNSNTSFSNTRLVGRYNITIFANNSFGGNANASNYFEVFLPILLNLSIIDKNNSGINSDWNIYYRNSLIASNTSSDGNVLHELPDSLVDLELKMFSNNLSVLLKDINLSNDNNKNFGADFLTTPISGYILTYGINNSFNFANATLKINYSNTDYTNESYLGLYKCDLWDFSNQTCSGSWTDVTSDSTQDLQGDILEYLTTSFSGFSIKQENYCGDGSCNNGETCSSCSDCGACPSTSPASGGGGGGGNKAKYECESNSECNRTYTCYAHKCVKLFDVEILKVEHLINSGNFSFSYLVKGMANFSGDVIIRYWIEKINEKIMLGQDTIYFGSFEEKRKMVELNLPINQISGDYDLYVQASFENYQAQSFRKINLDILKEEKQNISLSPIIESSFWKYVFLGFLIFILILIFSLKRYRKSTFYYLEKIRKRWILIEHDYLERTRHYSGKMFFHILEIIKELIIFGNHIFKKSINSSSVKNVNFNTIFANWLKKTGFGISMVWHYLTKLANHEIRQIKTDIYNNMDFVVSQNSIRVFRIGSIKKSRYIGFGCCAGSLNGKLVYSRGGHLVGKVIQPILDLANKKILGWLIKPDKRYGIRGQVLIYQKEFATIGDIIFVDNRIREYIHHLGNFCQFHPDSKNKVCNPPILEDRRNNLIMPKKIKKKNQMIKMFNWSNKLLNRFLNWFKN